MVIYGDPAISAAVGVQLKVPVTVVKLNGVAGLVVNVAPLGNTELSISMFTVEVACKSKLNWLLPSTQKEKLLFILLNVVFGPEVTILEGGLTAIQFFVKSCISLVTKPIIVPFLDSVTLIAATEVP